MIIFGKMEMQTHIDEIMDHFDFDRVHKVMTALDWRWITAEHGVPEKHELRQKARRLLTDAWRSEYKRVGTGGFYAEYEHDEDEGEALTLKFELESWSSYNSLDDNS
jgi:hypothetical protein